MITAHQASANHHGKVVHYPPPMNDTDPKAPPDKVPAPGTGSSADAQTVVPSTPAKSSPVEELPESFGRYRVQRQLGRGGMGTVYLAQDTHLDRPVALKVPHAALAADEALRERFYREARAAGRLNHPNICPIYDVGAIDGIHHMVMAYIEGRPLSELLSEYRNEARAAALMRSVALAMQEAHDAGIIHRDLKPGNIMIDRRGEPVVMDFGLARTTHTDSVHHTGLGEILGTPHYMSPEQASGDSDAVGPATDIYSLGVILYQLLCGRAPFQGSVTAVLVQLASGPIVSPSRYRGDLNPRLEAVCLSAMARTVAERTKSMRLFAANLEEFLHIPGATPVRAPGNAPAATGVVQKAIDLLRRWGWHRTVEILSEAPLPGGEAMLLSLTGDDSEPTRAFLEGTPPEFRQWVAMGQIYRALQNYDFGTAETLLEPLLSDTQAPADPVLEANLHHVNGFLRLRRGHVEASMDLLHRALALLGRDHFLTGRLLDTLGELYAGRNNYHAAREFHQLAIQCKEAHDDEAGVGFSRCRLGRLCMEWGELDQAEEHLNADLRLVQKTGQKDLEAQVLQYLARVMLERGYLEETKGRQAAARRHWAQATEWLTFAADQYKERAQVVLEGLAIKDLGEASVALDQLVEAEAHLKRAEEILSRAGYTKGLAEVQRVLGALHCKQGQYPQALKALQVALLEFDHTRQALPAARAQLALARTLATSKAMARIVTQGYLDALLRAEACRRTMLVRIVEQELAGVDPEALSRHVFHRVRGRLATADTTSLVTGASEQASVLFLNLKGFTAFCQGMDPGEIMVTLNQMLSDLEGALMRHQALVTAFLGGGFMAVLLGASHAERAVDTALDLFDVSRDFNRPREVLGLKLVPVRIGVASGSVAVGNIGTYRKMEFTAVGPAVTVASRLVRLGEGGFPCISQETYDLVQGRFHFRPDSPRTVDLVGIGRRQIWDVVGRARERSGSGKAGSLHR
jgi:class 3 adenylate cyclase/tetratricopeptide (TPR) repeat protein/predicted Ser/Thr protein kinase